VNSSPSASEWILSFWSGDDFKSWSDVVLELLNILSTQYCRDKVSTLPLIEA
jgi:hypothetical protein